MLKLLTSLALIGSALALAYKWQQQHRLQALPTAEHKARWENETRWSGTRWE